MNASEDFTAPDGQAYTVNYTQPASSLVATSAIWYDEAARASRAVVANTSQDRISLTTVAELLM